MIRNFYCKNKLKVGDKKRREMDREAEDLGGGCNWLSVNGEQPSTAQSHSYCSSM